MDRELEILIDTYIKKNSREPNMYTGDIDFDTDKKILEFLHKNKNDISKLIKDSTNINKGYMVSIEWLNNFPSTTKEVGYIMSFKSAGDILVEHSKDVSADYMFFSVMFNYMQYLELTLKNILSKNNQTVPYIHDISVLWNDTKPILRKTVNEEDVDIIDSIIKSIFPNGSTSMDFRYRTNKGGEENITNSYKLDLYVVKIWIAVYDTIIYHTIIYHTYGV